MRLWEVAEVGSGKRISLHWTYAAARRAASACPGSLERMRTLPRFARPLMRLVWW